MGDGYLLRPIGVCWGVHQTAPAEHDAKRNYMRCAMADETQHLYNLDDDEESDEFEYDRSNDIDAQTAAMVKAPMRESADTGGC